MDNEDSPPRRSSRKRKERPQALDTSNGDYDLPIRSNKRSKRKQKEPNHALPDTPQVGISPPSEPTQPFTPTHGTRHATQALATLYKRIVEDPNYGKDGFSVEIVEDNMYKWHIKLFDFGVDTQLHHDLFMYAAETGREECVLMEAVFPPTFPHDPPFLRVVCPRFFQYTGHITVGGSICVKELTRSGWSPDVDIMQLIIMVRNLLVEGGALVDMENPLHCYTEAEAHAAFVRVALAHGWTP